MLVLGEKGGGRERRKEEEVGRDERRGEGKRERKRELNSKSCTFSLDIEMQTAQKGLPCDPRKIQGKCEPDRRPPVPTGYGPVAVIGWDGDDRGSDVPGAVGASAEAGT